MSQALLEVPARDRRSFIGGSDIAAIMGLNPPGWRNIVDLWLDKIAPEPLFEDSKDKSRGRRMEPYVCDMIEQEYPLQVLRRNALHVDPDVPQFQCEVDAELVDRSNPNTPLEALVRATEGPAVQVVNGEIKTVHPFHSKEWGEVDTDQLPVHYAAQAMWNLGVTGRQYCRVFALIGYELRSYVVERDDQTIEAMREQAWAFWHRYVVPKAQPPLDLVNSAAALRTLERLYPGTDGRKIVANDQQHAWRDVYLDAKQLAERYNGIAEGAKAHLLAEMKYAAFLQFNDGTALRRRVVRRRGYTATVPESTYHEVSIINS